jgi:hypothetical protein
MTSESYWLLGMLASDGSIHRNVISISQSGDIGKLRIEKIKSIFGCDNPIYTYKPIKGQLVYTLNLSSAKLISELVEFNIIQNKTFTYTLPAIIPLSSLASFLDGYIEGDGTVGIYTNNTGIHTLTILVVGTESFLTSINNVVPVKGRLRKIPNENIYEIRWNGKKAIAFGKWLYSQPVFHDSPKLHKFNTYINNYIKPFHKYDSLKIEAQKLIDDGYDIMHIASILNMHFQLLYKWKSNGSLVFDSPTV